MNYDVNNIKSIDLKRGDFHKILFIYEDGYMNEWIYEWMDRVVSNWAVIAEGGISFYSKRIRERRGKERYIENTSDSE